MGWWRSCWEMPCVFVSFVSLTFPLPRNPCADAPHRLAQDAILRYGGIYTLALAYAGTGNNSAIRKLLHVAVSDVNDDVRRAAVTALGFLLFRNPTQVPRIVQLLSESYNPHVRYGSAMALGISCAGTGLEVSFSVLSAASLASSFLSRTNADDAGNLGIHRTPSNSSPLSPKTRSTSSVKAPACPSP